MFGEGIAKGMWVTFRHLFRRTFTVQYPEERIAVQRRFRGYEFVWYEERCTGCATCAKFCPLGTIRIVTHPDGSRAEGFSYAVDLFDIDTGRCMFCGLCVEACPYDALHMGTHFERASYSRSGLVIRVDELKRGMEPVVIKGMKKKVEVKIVAPVKQPSAYHRPQLHQHKYKEGHSLSAEEVGRPWCGRWVEEGRPSPQAPPVER